MPSVLCLGHEPKILGFGAMSRLDSYAGLRHQTTSASVRHSRLDHRPISCAFSCFVVLRSDMTRRNVPALRKGTEGRVEITGENVAVLTDMAVAAESIDEAKGEEARKRAETHLRVRSLPRKKLLPSTLP